MLNLRLGRKETREVRFTGVPVMASYRLYCLDGIGSIGLANWIEANSDEEALAAARLMTAGALNCEVWQGKRLVAAWKSQESMDSREPRRRAG